MTEKTVQLPQDSSANKNLFRVVAVLPAAVLDEYTASGFAPLQEAVVLSDDRGGIVQMADGTNLATRDRHLELLLRAVMARLDLIGYILDEGYAPPDSLTQEMFA